MLLVLLCFLAPSAQATPQLVGMAYDGRTLLWNNSDGNGAVALAVYNNTPFALYTYGPYPGWSAKALAVGYDGVPRILWTKTDGSAALWRIDANGGFSQTTYGPFSGWTAIGLAVGTNNVPRLLWSNTNGQMALWSVAADGSYTHAEYGPYPGYTAAMIAAGTNNIPRILWNKSDGSISLWYSTADQANYAHTEYGPFPGYSPLSLTAGATDSALRLLWNHPSDSTVSLWNMPTSGGYTYQNYTNPAGYVPVAANASVSGNTGYVDLLYSQSDGTALINYLGMDNASYNMETVTPTGIAAGVGGGNTGGGTGTATPNPHGSYSVAYSYTPGTSSSTDGASALGPATTSFDQSYGDTTDSVRASFSNAQAGTAAARLHGTFTATFTWQGSTNPDGSHAPAPAQVTVIKRSVVSYYPSNYSNVSASGDTGLGQHFAAGSTVATGFASEVKGGATFSVTCSPVVDLTATGGTNGSYAYATASFTAAAVTMNLAGTTLNKLNNTDAMLIGQQCTASLKNLPAAFAPGRALKDNISFAWGVSATSTFQSWNGTSGTTPVKAVTGPGPLNLPSAQWYWLDKASTQTITCAVTITPPSGQGTAFSLALPSQQINLQVPTSSATNYTGVGYVGPYRSDFPTWVYASPKDSTHADGSTWTTTVTMPVTPVYSGPGTWGYAQIITPKEVLTTDDGTPTSGDTTRVLDGDFPYQGSTHIADGSPYNNGDSPAVPVND